MRLIDADTLMKELEREVELADDWKTAHEIANCVKYAPTAVGWISVKDKLPEQKWIDYLVATRILTDGTRGFNIAWLNDDNGKWASNDRWICDGREIVTHWMPLPDSPKEEEHEPDRTPEIGTESCLR